MRPRLKYQINRRFKSPEDPLSKKRMDKPDNVEFLAFETNEQDKNKRYKGIGLDPINEFVLLQCRDWRPPPEPQRSWSRTLQIGCRQS